jgi:hypothetical protein
MPAVAKTGCSMTNQSDPRIDAMLILNDPLQPLEVVAKCLTAIAPLLGQLTGLYVELVREQRLVIEARLAARVTELAAFFNELADMRIQELDQRELQYRALSLLLDIARASGNAMLIAQAMASFNAYVRASPTLTRDFADALKAANFSLYNNKVET